MRFVPNHRIIFNIVAIFVLLSFESMTFATGLFMGRIIPKGTVTLFQGTRKVGAFSSEAPFPEGVFLSVQGDCAVKMSDLYLVAIDKSLFSVKTFHDSRRLMVNNGTVYFGLAATPYSLVFQTPDGVVTTHQIILNASAKSSLLKGYVSVTESITRVGVLEGGSIILSVDDGETKKINAGQELRLAQAGLFDELKEKKEEPKAEEEKIANTDKGWPTTTKVLVGVGSVAVGIGIAALLSGGGGSGDGAPSESSPSQ